MTIPLQEAFEFEDTGNYRGSLEVKREGENYLWRVSCDVYGSEWRPIPYALYEALRRHYMSRTDEQLAADYDTYRGRCQELSTEACKNNPELTLVRGHYFCTVWHRSEPHWWTTRKDGTIYDPSKAQFPSNGLGVYTPFDGSVSCSQCGTKVLEEDASFDSNYAFCSDLCHGRFVGIYD